MTLALQRHYVAGRWHHATTAGDNWICDANSRAHLQARAHCDGALIEDAMAYAHACHTQSDWARDPIWRAEILDRVAAHLSDPARLEAIAVADSLTTGVVINVCRRLTNMLPSVFTGAAQVIRSGYLSETAQGPGGLVEHFRRPWGPALLISPWNAPTLIGGHKLASALAGGAPALVKPSNWTPHSALAMFDAIDACGLPDGAAALLLCDRQAVAPMLSDARIRSVSFTGGLTGGRAVMAGCAHDFKPAQLELGGNNAFVVLEGADLDAAATAIVFGLCHLNGQWCRAIGRIIVASTLTNRLIDKVLDKLAQVKLGSSLDQSSQMGPQAHIRQYDDVHHALDRLRSVGGTCLQSTPLPADDGYFVAPALVVGCQPADTLNEIFGPIATVHSFDSEAEAHALANGPPFGLAGNVFGPEAHALAFARAMQTGGVKVNGYSMMALNSDFPRAAWMLSGLGEEGRRESIRFFTGARVVGVSPQDMLGV